MATDNPGDQQPPEPTWRDVFGCLALVVVLAAVCCYGPVVLFRLT